MYMIYFCRISVPLQQQKKQRPRLNSEIVLTVWLPPRDTCYMLYNDWVNSFLSAYALNNYLFLEWSCPSKDKDLNLYNKAKLVKFGLKLENTWYSWDTINLYWLFALKKPTQNKLNWNCYNCCQYLRNYQINIRILYCNILRLLRYYEFTESKHAKDAKPIIS